MRVERCDTAVGLVIAARNPSAREPRAVELMAGATIAQMIAHAVNIGAIGDGLTPEQVEDELQDLRVYVDGEALPFASTDERLKTLDLAPSAGSIVNLQVEPAGGSNSDGRTALTVILTAVAIVSSITVGPFTAAMWQIAAAIVPQLLFPVQTPDTLASANDNGALNSQANTIRKRGMMPLQLGAGRVAFDLAANAYSTNVNGDVWLSAIFGLHYGPCSLSEVKIGETLLSDYPAGDVQVEAFLTPGPRDFSFYAQQVHQENVNDELDIGGDAEVHTTQVECERVEVDLTWPQGLRFNKDSGSIVQQEIRVQIEWSPVGVDNWQAAPIEGGPYMSRTGVPLGQGVVDVMARTQDPVRRTFAWTKGDDAQVKVRIRAWDPDGDNAEKAVQGTYWTALRSVVFRKPILDETLACWAIRIKSSDDLGGTLPSVTGIITPHAPVWTGDEWLDDIADWAPSDNSIAHMRMMLMGPAAAKPFTADQFDLSLEEHYERIETYGWKGCFRLATEVTQEDALKVLGAIGRFACYDMGEGLVVVPDWEKPTPRQVFTGRNVKGFSYSRSFPEPCHAVVVEFLNIEEDGRDDEVIVYADGFDLESADLIESIKLEYQCTMSRAFKEGRNFHTKRKLGVEAYSWTAGVDAIVSAYGSRVLVRHKTALFGAAEGRVQFRHMAGGLVTGVRLDDVVEMVDGEDYALDVRRHDRVIPGLSVVTSPGRTRDLMFPIGLVDDDAPEAGDLVAFGVAGLVTEDVEISDFAPQGDGIQISARRYIGAEVAAAEVGAVPALQTRLTAKPRAPMPRLLGITQATPEGVKVAFDVDSVRGGLVESFPVRWRRHDEAENTWSALPALGATSRLVATPPILDAANPTGDSEGAFGVDIEIRTKLRNGDVSLPLVISNVVILRDVPEPIGFKAVGLKVTAPDGSAQPALRVVAEPVTSGLVQDLVVEQQPADSDPEAWVSAGQPLPAGNPDGLFTAVSPGQSYDVRARWRTSDNWSSDWVVETGVVVPTGALVSSDTASVGGILGAELREIIEAIGGPGVADLAERARLRIAEIFVQADLTAEAIIRQALTSVDDRAYQEAMTFLDGVPVGTVVRNEQIRTDTTITNLSLVTVRVGTAEAAIVTETSARIAGDAAEASARTILAARVTTAEAAIVTETSARVAGDAAEASARVTLAARVTTAEAAIVTEQTTRANADTAEASARVTLAARVTTAESTISSNYTTLAAADSAEATARLALAARTTAAEAAIVSNYSTLADADSAEATARLALASRVTTAEAAIVTEQTTRASADSALTSITTSQGSRLTTAESTIVSNYTTLAAADAALSAITTSLNSRMGSAESSITSNYTTLVTADTALAARSEVLEATATAALNPNDRFGTWPTGQTFPTHWANGANATSNIAKVTGGLSPNGKRLVGPAGVDVYDQTSSLFALPPGWYVLSAHVTLNSGALTGSGVVLNAFAAGPSYLTAYSLQFAVDADINETVQGAGTAGKSYIFAKLIQVTQATAALGNLYSCAHNSGLGSISGANSVTFHQVAIRPASNAEVAGKRASADVVTATARIATEETVRASGDSALAARATTLEAQMANSSGSGLSARIATEEGVRLTNDNALAARATTLEAQIANSSGSGLQSRIATEESARATAVATVASSVTSLTSTVNGHTSTITTQASTLADLSGKLQAYAKWTAAAGGNEAYVELVAANDGSLLNLVAKSIRLGSGGTPVIIVESGVAKMTNVEISGSLLLGATVVSSALALGAAAETAGAPASGSWTGEGWSQRASTTITGAANEVMMLYPSGSVVTNGGTSVDIQDCEWQIKRNGAVIYGPLYAGSGSLGRDAGSGQNARLTTAIQGAYRDAAPAVGSNVYTLEVRVTGDGGAPTRTGTDMALFAVRLKRQA